MKWGRRKGLFVNSWQKYKPRIKGEDWIRTIRELVAKKKENKATDARMKDERQKRTIREFVAKKRIKPRMHEWRTMVKKNFKLKFIKRIWLIKSYYI
jgi:hypothetical protein